MTAAILGLGTALPAYSVPQMTSAAMSAPMCCTSDEQTKRLESLYRRSGIAARYSVLLQQKTNGEHGSGNGNGHGTSELDSDASPENPFTQSFFEVPRDIEDHGPGTAARMKQYIASATPLALEASLAALKEAAVDAASIEHLITVSCTGFAAPGVDVAMIERLGLSRDVSRTNVGFMGCHAAFNALRVASALSREDGRDSHVLICAVELCSLHFAYGWDLGRVVANALFADGAGAVVVGPGGVSRDESAWRLAASGAHVIPDSTHAMTWHITDHGFEMTLSPQIPSLIRQHLRPWLQAWLARQGLTIETVASWAVHPGGPRILQSVQDSLGLSSELLADSQAVLEACGNMSSPTILFILDRLRRRSAPRPCVALGLGPGLAIEAMLLV